MPIGDKLQRRAAKLGLALPDDLAAQLVVYFELLRKWNRKVSLTALPVDSAGEEAIDRLLLEPLAAARYLPGHNSTVIDVGSGGGSPAIPLKLAAPGTSLRMVEAKTRKAAFLREAVRALSLGDTDVYAVRLEELLARPALHEAADVVTVRAVRLDRKLLSRLEFLIRPAGMLCVFTASRTPAVEVGGLTLSALDSHALLPHYGTRLERLQKRQR